MRPTPRPGQNGRSSVARPRQSTLCVRSWITSFTWTARESGVRVSGTSPCHHASASAHRRTPSWGSSARLKIRNHTGGEYRTCSSLRTGLRHQPAGPSGDDEHRAVGLAGELARHRTEDPLGQATCGAPHDDQVGVGLAPDREQLVGGVPVAALETPRGSQVAELVERVRPQDLLQLQGVLGVRGRCTRGEGESTCGSPTRTTTSSASPRDANPAANTRAPRLLSDPSKPTTIVVEPSRTIDPALADGSPSGPDTSPAVSSVVSVICSLVCGAGTSSVCGAGRRVR